MADSLSKKNWNQPDQHFHIGKSSAGTIIAVVGGVLVLGVGGYFLYKALTGGKDITENLSFSVDPMQETVKAGSLCKSNVSVTNTATEGTVSPQIRFDIKKGTSGWTTVNENPAGFVPFGDIGPGETVTKEMSMLIPADWAPGSEVYGRVVCLSHEGVVWTDLIATIPSPVSVDIDATPVTANIPIGGTAQLNVTFNNPNDSDVELQLAFDVTGSSSWSGATSPSEQNVYQTFIVKPGSSNIVLTSKPFPINWVTGTKIKARIMGKAKISGSWSAKYIAWGGDSNYVFSVGGTPAQVYLKITSPGLNGLQKKCIDVGQAFSYSFSVQNTGTAPITADFIVGFRDQGYTSTYTELNTTKTIPVGTSTVTVLSKPTTAPWSGKIVDIRVLVRKGANIIVTNDQGDATSEGGVQSDIIYEGDKVAYIGPSKLQAYSNESFVIRMTPTDRRVAAAGQAVSFTLGFKHVGPAKSYKAGVYINDTSVGPYWLTAVFNCPEDTGVTSRQVVVSGQFKKTSLGAGQVIDCMMAFMEANVTPSTPKVDSQLLFANWDSILTVK